LGFFSVLEYAVRQRTREIGIRIALGARSRHVVQSLLAPASIAMSRGLAFGAAGAIYVGFAMRRAEIPSGVHPLDALTLAVVTVVLVAAAFVAAFRPARRAMRIEPSEALRVE
jgi:putative ABC transport system permease protein